MKTDRIEIADALHEIASALALVKAHLSETFDDAQLPDDALASNGVMLLLRAQIDRLKALSDQCSSQGEIGNAA